MDIHEVKNKVFVVTGKINGLVAIVKTFSEAGAKHIAILDNDELAGRSLEDDLKPLLGFGRVVFHKCDVTNNAEVNTVFETIMDEFGNIDIVINNSDVVNYDNFLQEIDFNMTATITVTLKALKHMRVDEGGKGGCIINTSSMQALKTGHGMPVYTATKNAVLHFSHCLGMPQNYAEHGVRVLTICLESQDTISEQNLKIDSSHIISEKAAKGVLVAYERGASGSTWLISPDEDPLDYSDNVKAMYNYLGRLFNDDGKK